ncbi:MAG: LON peptidase substrate-binding domain-containing protein, partial [Steroidobacter sp.]
MNTKTQNPGADSLISDDMLIILPMRNLVLFPGTVFPAGIQRELSIAAAKEAVRTTNQIGFLLQRDPDVQQPGPDDLYKVGTVANILRYVPTQDGRHHLIVQGERRFRVLDFQPGLPFLLARVEYLPEYSNGSSDIEARTLNLKRLAAEALQLLPQAPTELANAVQNVESPAQLADLITSFLDITSVEKQRVLELTELRARLDRVTELLSHRIEVMKLQRQIESNTREAIDDRQKEFVLREQMRQIQKQLGEGEESSSDELKEVADAIDKAGMPQEALDQAKKELKRLQRMPDASGEYSMIRTWLDWMIQLPWSKLDTEAIDIIKARKVLDEDHYGLEKIKRRIVEYLAVRKLNPQGRSPILCFVGPPGVGKTSLGQSIARSLDLKFVRASLGGLHDEAEIRGHRRTY